jgi:hypothetical protein
MSLASFAVSAHVPDPVIRSKRIAAFCPLRGAGQKATAPMIEPTTSVVLVRISIGTK